MAAYNKFNSWVEYMCETANCGSDQFVVALSNAANAPSASADLNLADITTISYTNLSSRNLTTSTASQSSGTYTLLFADLVLTASGGAVAAFRYVNIYDDTVTSPVADPFVGWYDYGSDLTLADTETLTVDWTTSSFTVV